jgi:hypothetical protein
LFEPRPYPVRRERIQVDDGAAPIVDVLAAVDEAEVLEFPGQLAGGRQRQFQLPCELAHGPLALGPDVGENGDVAAREPGLAADEGQKVVARAAASPEPAHHPAQVTPELVQLGAVCYHLISVII